MKIGVQKGEKVTWEPMIAQQKICVGIEHRCNNYSI